MRNSMSLSFLIHGVAIIALLALLHFKPKVSVPTDVSISEPKTPSLPGAALAPIQQTQSADHSKKIEAQTQDSSVVSQAAAPEKIGISEQNAYFLEIQKRIQAQERYPVEARKRGIEAIIEVSFQLNDQGEVIEIHSISGEKPIVLIEAALEAVKAASPFPAPPAGSSRVFHIPIEFKIK